PFSLATFAFASIFSWSVGSCCTGACCCCVWLGCSSVFTFSLSATCSELLSSVLDFSSSDFLLSFLSSSDFLSSFFLSLLDDFVSFLSSNLLSSCPHSANTKKLANNKKTIFFISHSPFFLFKCCIKYIKKFTKSKVFFEKSLLNVLTLYF